MRAEHIFDCIDRRREWFGVDLSRILAEVSFVVCVIFDKALTNNSWTTEAQKLTTSGKPSANDQLLFSDRILALEFSVEEIFDVAVQVVELQQLKWILLDSILHLFRACARSRIEVCVGGYVRRLHGGGAVCYNHRYEHVKNERRGINRCSA